MQQIDNTVLLIAVGVAIAAIVIVLVVGRYKWKWQLSGWFKGQTIDSYGGVITTAIVYAALVIYFFDLITREQFLIVLVLSPAGFMITMLSSYFMGLRFSKGRLPLGLQIRRYDEGTRKPKMNVHVYDLAERAEYLTPDVTAIEAELRLPNEPESAFEERKKALQYFKDNDNYRYMRIPLYTGYHDAEMNKTMYGIVIKVRKEYAGIESLFFKSTIPEEYNIRGAAVSVLAYMGTLRVVARDPLTDELLCTSMDTRETIENATMAWEKNDVLVIEHVQSKPIAEALRRAKDYIGELEDRVDNLEGLEFVREGWESQYSALGWEQPKFSKKTWTVLAAVAIIVIALAVAAYFLWFGVPP